MNIDEHFNQAVDMFKVGNGAFRKVEAFEGRTGALQKRLLRTLQKFKIEIRGTGADEPKLRHDFCDSVPFFVV